MYRVDVPLRDRRRDGHWGAEAQSYSRMSRWVLCLSRGLSEKKTTIVDPALMAPAIEWESVERTSNGLDGPSMTTVISRPLGDVDLRVDGADRAANGRAIRGGHEAPRREARPDARGAKGSGPSFRSQASTAQGSCGCSTRAARCTSTSAAQRGGVASPSHQVARRETITTACRY